MKKLLMLAITLTFALAFAGTSMAVPSGKTIVFTSPMGKVVFSGKIHADAGKKCADCHPKIFKMKKGADKITMKDIYAGKFCGTCHNGKIAFKAKTNCMKCHKK